MSHKLSLFGLIMVVAGSCIGIGIFLTPAFIAAQLPSPGWILVVWLVGGLSTLSAAFTFGELASRFPRKAGIYYWLKETYGDFWGFLFGWLYLSVLVSGAIAAISLGFAQYAAALFPRMAGFGQAGQQAAAIALIGILCIINYLGLKWGDWSTRVLTLLKIGGIFFIIVIGMAMGQASPSFQLNLVETSQDGSLLQGFGVALAGVSFSYAGIQYATFLASDAQNPARNVALAMVAGVLLVSLLYIAVNYAYLKLLPVQEIIVSGAPAADSFEAVSTFLGKLVPVIIMISAAGTASSFTLAAPRMYQAMAEDGLFFPFLVKKDARFHTPARSIVVQSGLAVAWVLFWGTFAGILTHLVITNLFFMVMSAVSIYILRCRTATQPAFPSPGYPVVPLLYIAVSVYIIIASSVSSPMSLVISAIFVVIGWLIYRYGL